MQDCIVYMKGIYIFILMAQRHFCISVKDSMWFFSVDSLDFLMLIIELRFSKYHFYWSLYSQTLNDICKERVFQCLVFLLEPANIAFGVTGEFIRLAVTEFGSTDVITSVVKLLAYSNFGIAETAIIFKMVWDFLVLYQIFFSSQEKRCGSYLTSCRTT